MIKDATLEEEAECAKGSVDLTELEGYSKKGEFKRPGTSWNFCKVK